MLQVALQEAKVTFKYDRNFSCAKNRIENALQVRGTIVRVRVWLWKWTKGVG
jgi:hypothetical protein